MAQMFTPISIMVGTKSNWRIEDAIRTNIMRTVWMTRLKPHRGLDFYYLMKYNFMKRYFTKNDGTPRPLAAHVSYLLQRWNDGCRNATQLWRELQDHGHLLSARTVSRYVTVLRREAGVPWKFTPVAPSTTYDPLVPVALTVRQAVRLMQCRPEHFTSREHAQLKILLAREPLIARTYQQVQQFCQMVRTRGGTAFAAWMHDVEQTGCPELQAFVASLRKDADAVHMGLTLPWSQGAVEGHVHRIKFIKRSGYGRMNFATLRQRVLIRPAN